MNTLYIHGVRQILPKGKVKNIFLTLNVIAGIMISEPQQGLLRMQ